MEAGSGLKYEAKQQREPNDMPIDVIKKDLWMKCSIE